MNIVALDTKNDGNFLFHAVSLNLFGSELKSFKIKLASVFLCYVYEIFIKTFLQEYSYRFILRL